MIGRLEDCDADTRFMAEALKQARAAADADEVPVGAVIVCDGRIIGRAHNQREMLHDPTAHAEMIAITQAAEAMGSWRLNGCTVYVTVEPCPMCAGAMVLARIDRVVYGVAEGKSGAARSVFRLLDSAKLNHNVEVTSGVMADECRHEMTQFFRKKRDKGEPVEETTG